MTVVILLNGEHKNSNLDFGQIAIFSGISTDVSTNLKIFGGNNLDSKATLSPILEGGNLLRRSSAESRDFCGPDCDDDCDCDGGVITVEGEQGKEEPEGDDIV